MKRKKEHISMMKAANGGVIQCIIAIGLQSDFEALGFVDHIDKLTAPDSFHEDIDGWPEAAIEQAIDPLTLKPVIEEKEEPTKESKSKKKKAATAS